MMPPTSEITVVLCSSTLSQQKRFQGELGSEKFMEGGFYAMEFKGQEHGPSPHLLNF